MPTFLALQCYKCNMMQVKHAKKSSNKWSCSVCNEKQSVRKVFATSTAAKDVRNFVQHYNLSRNITQDRTLAELAEEGMCNDAPSFNIFCDEFHQHHVKAENKWTEYLSPEEGLNAETSEVDLDDAKFVTSFPEKIGRKPKGGVRVEVKEQDDGFSLNQQQRLSVMRKRSGKLSNKSIKSFTECHDDVLKENYSPSLWATKASPGSSLHVQKNAGMHHRQQLAGYKVLQETVADVSIHKRKGVDAIGERVLLQANFESKTNVASKVAETSRGVNERPVSRWATYLDVKEDVRLKGTCTSTEQEKHVSKWAKYMDSEEVKPRVEATQNSGPAAKWGKYLDASESVFLKLEQPQEMSNIWSLKSSSDLQYSNSLARTELDDLLNTSCISEEVDEEVHSLFA